MSDKTTDLFLALTPHAVLDAVEAVGLRTNALSYPLNSFENRVYEVELEDRSRIVAKFYRPGRWTKDQILDEHAFLADLAADEVPLCGVAPLPTGETLAQTKGIHYCIFERKGGRAPDELDDALVQRLGMLAARIHNTGAKAQSRYRTRLNSDTYIRSELDLLKANNTLPLHLVDRFEKAALAIGDIADARMKDVETIRIHGDFHKGNILARQDVLHVLDFDDMVVGPPVQDLWMLLPGRDPHTLAQRELFIQGYEQFRKFDRSTLRLIEPLRGLRIVRFVGWLARRWHDPIFPATWPHFGTETFWDQETRDLEDLLDHIRKEDPATTNAPISPTETLTNKDFFWDLE
jgi:Ser/Thr protein kinase RdoA (MazF antagonist)